MRGIALKISVFLLISAIFLSNIVEIFPRTASQTVTVTGQLANTGYNTNVVITYDARNSDTTYNSYGGYTSDINRLASEIRFDMLNRKKSITVKYLGKSQITEAQVEKIFDLAFKETDSPIEGDYLNFAWKHLAYKTDGAIKTVDGTKYYLFDITYSLTYYTTKAQEEELGEEINRIIKSFGFNENTTQRQKLDRIYTYIANNVAYDYEHLNNESYLLQYTAYAALINKTAVCEGYAALLYRMAKECGINARIITGSGNTARDSNHAWNIVELNGKYYYVDVTWDSELIEFEYYLRGSTGFYEHTVNEKFLTAEFKKEYPVSKTGLNYKSKLKIEKDFRYTVVAERVIIRDYVGTNSKVVVPATLGGKKVYCIDEGTFNSNMTVEKITISNGVRVLTYKGIYNCNQLKEVVFPKSLTVLFQKNTTLTGIPLNCEKLSKITVSSENPYITVYDGILYSKDKKQLLQCPAGTAKTVVNIPEGTTTINNYAFEGCESIGHIKLSSTVKTVGHYAFINCYNLASIIIPKGVTQIGSEIFHPNDGITVYGTYNTSAQKYSDNYKLDFKLVTKFKCSAGHKFKKVYESGSSSSKTYRKVCSVCGDKGKSQHDNLKNVDNFNIKLQYESAQYTGSYIKPKIVSLKVDGVTLKANVDYKITGYSNNLNVGTAYVHVKGIGKYKGTDYATFEITSRDIENVKVSGLDVAHVFANHKEIKPDVTLTLNGIELIEGTDYTLEYKDNRCIGTAMVHIAGKGNFGGHKVANFEIKSAPHLKAPKNFKLSLGGINKVTAKWDKVTGADGYYLYYKTSNDKHYKFLKTTKTSATVSSLKQGSKYTFMIIPYEIVDGCVCIDDDHYAKLTVYTKRNLSAPKSVSATLYGHNDVAVKWSKVTNANGYYLYYKKTSAKSYTLLKKTTSTSYKKANLSDGVNYTFKVIPYYVVGGKTYKDDSYKTASCYTLKKVAAPKTAKSSSSKVKVSWTNIQGESGYQISASTSKSGTRIVSTYTTTTGKSKEVSAKKGKTYYYKVRAFKTVSGKKIYGPWSAVKAYKLK